MGYRSANINVVDSGDQLGRTVADYGKGNVNVALEVDVQKAAPNLIEIIYDCNACARFFDRQLVAMIYFIAHC